MDPARLAAESDASRLTRALERCCTYRSTLVVSVRVHNLSVATSPTSREAIPAKPLKILVALIERPALLREDYRWRRRSQFVQLHREDGTHAIFDADRLCPAIRLCLQFRNASRSIRRRRRRVPQ